VVSPKFAHVGQDGILRPIGNRPPRVNRLRNHDTGRALKNDSSLPRTDALTLLSRDCKGAVRSLFQHPLQPVAGPPQAGWWHRLQPVAGHQIRSFAPVPHQFFNAAVPARRRLLRDFSTAVFLLALVLTATACKGKHNRVIVQNEEETTPQMASLVRMNDLNASAQILSGFYGLENNSWRWTSGKFSVLLRTPPNSAAQGGVITFSFSLPDIVIQRLKTVAITASVNGTKLKSAEYEKPGANIFTADVPPALLTGDSVKVDFTLDKTIPPDVDKRDLGVVATSIGIAGK
jgi:hypothetical protein